MTPAQRATAAYVAPFGLFVGLMALDRAFGIPIQVAYPIRFVAVSAVFLWLSRGLVWWRPRFPLASVALGVAVFFIWIGPDALFGPGYRRLWIFQNALTGAAASSVSDAFRHNAAFVLIRTVGSMALVPVIEELFWRGWLMRWLISVEFVKVPIGQYARRAFWMTAVLFAAEHGPYWEVGLAAGILYNWWVVRTRNLSDAMLAHAVTNGMLAAYVMLFDRWQYWL